MIAVIDAFRAELNRYLTGETVRVQASFSDVVSVDTRSGVRQYRQPCRRFPIMNVIYVHKRHEKRGLWPIYIRILENFDYYVNEKIGERRSEIGDRRIYS